MLSSLCALALSHGGSSEVFENSDPWYSGPVTQKPAVFDEDVRYYTMNRSSSQTTIGDSNVTYFLSGHNTSMDWAIGAPAITRLDIPVGGTFPAEDLFWLEDDAFYVVMDGNVTFGSAKNAEVHEYGDVFWVLGGTPSGQLKNVGDAPVIVNVMTESNLQYKTGTPPQGSPALGDDDEGSQVHWLKTRSYRRAGYCGWSKNPSPHSDECIKNGGVYNCQFPAVNNTPPLLRVRWSPKCQIPYHYHPTGAMYFIQYGHMLFKGDRATWDETLVKGDVRWVRPGYDYGPEYNDELPMQITVFGVDSPPTFQAPPIGPYRVQKEVFDTHVFE